MRIMYLLFSFTIGGTERLVADICNEMVKNNDVYLYIVNDYCSESLLSSIDSSVHVFLEKRKVGGNKVAPIVNVTRYIIKNKIDVVHCNSFSSPQLLVLKNLLFRHVKVIQTIHSIGNFSGMKKWKKRIYSGLIDTFVAISNAVRDDVVSAGFSEARVKVIYNAINVQKYVETAMQTERKPCRNIENNLSPIHIGYLGRIDLEKKGQDILLNALKLVKGNYQIECLIGGAPDEAHQADMEVLNNLAARIENESTRIVFCGLVTDVLTFYKNLDIFVMPSRSEGFGISLVEAMAMGIPCVSCDQNGPAEIIGNNERGLLFHTGDANDLADKLVKMIEGDYKQHLNHLEYVKENFNIQSMCCKLKELYIYQGCNKKS